MNESTAPTIVAIICGLTCLLPVLSFVAGVWFGRTRVRLTIEPRSQPDRKSPPVADGSYAIRDK